MAIFNSYVKLPESILGFTMFFFLQNFPIEKLDHKKPQDPQIPTWPN